MMNAAYSAFQYTIAPKTPSVMRRPAALIKGSNCLLSPSAKRAFAGQQEDSAMRGHENQLCRASSWLFRLFRYCAIEVTKLPTTQAMLTAKSTRETACNLTDVHAWPN